MRWRHPERGLIAPDHFIPLAEETGLIVPIGRWVLREGCRQARRMRDALPADAALTMSINLSVKQLQHSDVVADVRDALARGGTRAVDPDARDHRDGADGRHGPRGHAARGAQGARRAAGPRRLRHRLLVAQLPEPVPGRHPQDGPVLPARRRDARDVQRSRPPSWRSGRRSAARSSPRASRCRSSGDSLRELGCDLGQGFHFALPDGRRRHARVPAARLGSAPAPAALPGADAP